MMIMIIGNMPLVGILTKPWRPVLFLPMVGRKGNEGLGK